MRPSRLLRIICLLLSIGCGDDDGPKASDDGGGGRQDSGIALPASDSGSSSDSGSRGDSGTRNDGGVVGASDAMAGTPTSDAASEGPATGPTAERYFPAGAFMYQRIDSAALDPDSAKVTQWLQNNGGWGNGGIMQIDFSIEVLDATSSTPRRAFTPKTDEEEFYTPDCDTAPFPVPTGGALEGETGYACESDGDCHLIVVDRAEGRLYEMWRADIRGSTFLGGCAAVWDMKRVYGPEGRGEQCSSADAAGFPIAPLLFSADEVAAGSIDHAIRFILPNARMRAKTYQHPGNHAGGPSGPTDAPIYGSRWRLRANFDLASLPNEGARVVARALQRYGMALADGGNIALTGQSDRFTTKKWAGLLAPRDLSSIKPADFEIVQTGEPISLTYDCARTPIAN